MIRGSQGWGQEPSPYHPITRWLHAGLVFGVTFQLICVLLMTHPDHMDGEHSIATVHSDMHQQESIAQAKLGQWTMSAHRSVGILVVLIVFANFIWALMRRGEAKKRQIAVLFSVIHWRESWQTLKKLLFMFLGKEKLPEPGNSLSLIVEMLGMLTITAMAISGAIIWVTWAGPGDMVTELAETWMGVHAAVAIALFLYLAGHVSMALLYMRSGDAIFSRISPVSWKKK